MLPKRLSFIATPLEGSITLLLVVLFGIAIYLHESGALIPGPLSAAKARGTELGGYPSHAAFEQECGHCHAPIHCVTDTRCQDCHIEVARQRSTANGLHGRLPAGRCQTCNIEHRGRDAVITEFAFANVDHEKLAHFSLIHHQADYDGNSLTCESCHSQDRFANEILDCLTCHANADHDFVAEHIELFGANCLNCHDGRDRMDNFDHAQHVAALAGSHLDLDCQQCHIEQIFAGTPRECAGCHEEPAVHAGQFGTDCARCHGALAWAPAQLTQHTFRIDYGHQGELECQTCHTHTYSEHTCYGCHDHTPHQIQQTHLQEGINEFENCVVCHPTGEKGEGERLINSGSVRLASN